MIAGMVYPDGSSFKESEINHVPLLRDSAKQVSKVHQTRLRNLVHEFEWIDMMVLQSIPFNGRQEEDTGSRNKRVPPIDIL